MTKTNPLYTNVKEYSKLVYSLLKGDHDVLTAIGGMTGSGKSTLAILLNQEVSRIAGKPWSFENNCTWSREEFIYWVNGEQLEVGVKKSTPGRPPKQKPEYSSILLDELYSLVYKRNWYSNDQKVVLSLLNSMRDRHLFVCGNVPSFWDLDTGFLSRVRYYIFVKERGVAWIFQQENNPFSSDPWNVIQNRKLFRKNRGTPYKLANFVAELHYPDLTPEQKEQYLAIRNSKRMQLQEDIQTNVKEKYPKLKGQRDILLRELYVKHKVKQIDLAKLVGLDLPYLSRVINNG